MDTLNLKKIKKFFVPLFHTYKTKKPPIPIKE